MAPDKKHMSHRDRRRLGGAADPRVPDTLVLAGSIIATTAAQATQAGDAVPPLIAAIWREDFDAVKRLVEQGADPNAYTASGAQRPAWMWAIVARDAPATELLLSKVTTVERATALQTAANRNDASLARTLLDKGMPVDARGTDRSTALLIAAASGHVDVLRLLIERGASVNAADDFGDTALMAAVRAGSLEAVNALVAARADVNLADKKDAPLWPGRSGPASRHRRRFAPRRRTTTRAISASPTAGWPWHEVCADSARNGDVGRAPALLRPVPPPSVDVRAVTLAQRRGFAIDKHCSTPRSNASEGDGGRRGAHARRSTATTRYCGSASRPAGMRASGSRGFSPVMPTQDCPFATTTKRAF